MSSLCPTCLGKHFVYSPGGYAPKIGARAVVAYLKQIGAKLP